MTGGDQGDRGDRDDQDDRADQRGLSDSGPTLEVVAGHPTADELAALTVALAAALAAGEQMTGPGSRRQAGGASPAWADRSWMVGAPLRAGPDAWRRSAWRVRAG
jgi:hypothetical protein